MLGTWQTISLFGYISKSFLVLWFFSLSVDKQNSHTFLIFFWRHFNLPIWADLGKTAYSSHHRHVCLLQGLLANWLVWFFPLCGFDLPPASYHVGLLTNRHLAFKSVACCCLPVHTPILGKLDRQSVRTRPWPEFNSSDFSSTSAGLWKKKKEIERVYNYE